LEQRNNIIYKISGEMQNTTLEYYIHIKDQKNKIHKRNRQRISGNWQGTESNKLREFTEIYSTIHIFVQQKEIQETTGKKRIELQNQSTRRHAKRVKCQSLIKFIIYITIFLYSKER